MTVFVLFILLGLTAGTLFATLAPVKYEGLAWAVWALALVCGFSVLWLGDYLNPVKAVAAIALAVGLGFVAPSAWQVMKRISDKIGP